jgi:hypothetical protein
MVNPLFLGIRQMFTKAIIHQLALGTPLKLEFALLMTLCQVVR